MPKGTTQSAVMIHIGDTFSILKAYSSSILGNRFVNIERWKRRWSWKVMWLRLEMRLTHVYALPRRQDMSNLLK